MTAVDSDLGMAQSGGIVGLVFAIPRIWSMAPGAHRARNVPSARILEFEPPCKRQLAPTAIAIRVVTCGIKTTRPSTNNANRLNVDVREGDARVSRVCTLPGSTTTDVLASGVVD